MLFEEMHQKISAEMQTWPIDIESLCRSLNVKLKAGYLTPQIVAEIELNIDNTYTITYCKSLADLAYNRRFAIAHELGHLVLHRHLIGHGLNDSKEFKGVNVGHYFNSDVKRHHEAEANKFAAALLMPEELIRADSPHLDVNSYCEKYQVSERALLLRLKSLGLGIE